HGDLGRDHGRSPARSHAHRRPRGPRLRRGPDRARDRYRRRAPRGRGRRRLRRAGHGAQRPPHDAVAAAPRGASAMSTRDMVLAAATSVVWGLGFAAGKVGLESFSPAQLTAARFLVACLPVLVVPRPAISWSSIALIGATLFTGQFLLMFFAFEHGLPPGLASVTQQLQAFFTVLLAALFLGDVPTRRQVAGMAMAFAGLVLIGSTAGADLRL